MRKRRRSITIINNEIDYDKLAEAVVRANVSATEDNNAATEQGYEKINIFKLIYYIVFNKKRSNGTMTSGLLGGLIALAFNAIAVLGAIVLICGIVALVNIIRECVWTVNLIPNNVMVIAFMVGFLLVVAMFALIFRGVANEMAIEKDRDYTVAVFSGIVSFAALVVSLIALLKGVI